MKNTNGKPLTVVTAVLSDSEYFSCTFEQASLAIKNTLGRNPASLWSRITEINIDHALHIRLGGRSFVERDDIIATLKAVRKDHSPQIVQMIINNAKEQSLMKSSSR